jgi:integrase
VVEHLRLIPSFHPVIFPWPYNRRRLFVHFNEIQAAGGLVDGEGKAKYGLHDLRRAFATMNADGLSADTLQVRMQHKGYTTTQVYINVARQMKPTAEGLFAPELPKREVSG